MRKYVLAVCLIFLASTQAQFASDLFSRSAIGIKGGINLSSLNYTDDSYNDFDNNMLLKGVFGAFFDLGLTRDFSVGVEILYVGKGGELEYSDPNSNNFVYDLNSSNVDIRIPIKYTFNYFKKVTPYIAVHPNIGITTGGNITLDDKVRINANTAMVHNYDVKIGSANHSSMDFGIGADIGVKLPLHISNFRFYVLAELGYNFGLTDTYSEDEIDRISHAQNTPWYFIDGDRTYRGFEAKIGINIPFSNFVSNKPKEAAAAVATVNPAITRKVELPKNPDDKPCYTIDEMNELMSRGLNVTGQKVCMFDINFDKNSEELNAPSMNQLDKIYNFMNAHPNVYIQINGHTDNTGTAEYNMILSKRRAETVRSYLTKKGIASSRLTVEYFGMSSPITTNDTEEGRNQNRRVEFVIVK